MSDQQAIDVRAFRDALGAFATGITIVTTQDASGRKAGLTVNSFSSVSLAPPLVLWSIDRESNVFDAFNESDYFNVHVLADHQRSLSERFSGADVDRFDGVSLEQGVNAAPLIAGCLARFQCQKVHQYDGGDHLIMVGNVLRFDRSDQQPLLYFSGQYSQIAQS